MQMSNIEKFYYKTYPGVSILKSFDELLPNLENKKIIDIGCGTGRYFTFFHQSGASELVGIDVGENLLRIAKQLCPSVKVILASADVLPFPNEHFDVVLSMGLLEHFEDPQPILREWVRILKCSGFLILETPNMLNPIFARYYYRNKESLVWQHEWTPKDLIREIEKNRSLKFNRFTSSIVFPYLAGRFIDNKITRIFRLPVFVAKAERIGFLKSLGHIMFVSAIKVGSP
jgi:2-polyprenyl-3-methyl-5-hydroxy-6-metoxy-1,4-benzoquinol methylase